MAPLHSPKSLPDCRSTVAPTELERPSDDAKIQFQLPKEAPAEPQSALPSTMVYIVTFLCLTYIPLLAQDLQASSNVLWMCPVRRMPNGLPNVLPLKP